MLSHVSDQENHVYTYPYVLIANHQSLSLISGIKFLDDFWSATSLLLYDIIRVVHITYLFISSILIYIYIYKNDSSI